MDLINEVANAVRVTKKRHQGCNILVNDGKCAGQFILHMHVHIIPKDPGDKIKIETFKRKNLKLLKFKALSEMLRKELN